MGSKIDKNNIIKASMEELTEHEPRAYLVAEEHLREQFLQGFKKERGGLFKRVGEFVMPSFKLNDNKVTQAQLVRPVLFVSAIKADRSDRSNTEWLQQWIDHYRARLNDMCEAIEDSEDLDKLGQGFTSADPLEKVDLGDGSIPRPTFVNKNLSIEYKADLIKLLKEYVDFFAWEYSEIPGLSRDLVEHHLPIKAGLRPD